LKFVARRLNQYIVSQFFDGKYSLQFCGLDDLTAKDEAALDSQLVKTYNTINEIRISKGLKKIPGGDIISDGIYTSAMQMEKQNEMNSKLGIDEEQQNAEEEKSDETEENNPFVKAFSNYIDDLNKN
jgi:hypothetical protein